MRFLQITLSIMVAMCIASCSGGYSNPIASSTQTNIEHANSRSSNTMLWGFWDVQIDVGSESITAIPLRGASFTANVIKFIDGPPVNLILNLGTIDIQPNYMDIPVDVGLKHPFPGLNAYMGFDVLGVFMGNGSAAYLGPDGFPVQGASDQILMNPDGFTRWFNASEFSGAGDQMALLGYKPGKLGTAGYTPTAVLNPYKYFADGLGKLEDAFEFLANNASDRGVFKPGSTNYRHYDLRFPTPVPGVKFQYAVIAHWEPNINHPNPPSSIDDFPVSANSDEAPVIKVEDFSTAYYVSPTNFGGNVILDISPIDWTAKPSVVMEEYVIKCYSAAWSGAALADMTPTASGSNWHKFRLDVPVTTLNSSGSLPVWVEINYPTLDYTNQFGISNDANGSLSSYFLTTAEISNEAPPVQTGWARTWGGDREDETASVATDSQGNIYITGRYVGVNVDFDPDPTKEFLLTSNNFGTQLDVFLTKFNSSGTFQWAFSWGGQEIISTGVAVDSKGDVYLCGGFRGPNVDFDPGPGQDLKTSSYKAPYYYMDIFLTKYDSDGKYLKGLTWGGNFNTDSAHGLCVDSLDNVYVTGHFFGTNINFNPDPSGPPEYHSFHGTSVNYYDAFLSKFNSAGVFLGARTWGGLNNEAGDKVSTDAAGNVYVAGVFQGTVDFDPNESSGGIWKYTSEGGSGDIFISKFNASYAFTWAYYWGGTGYDTVWGMKADAFGNIYTAGGFSGSANFNPNKSGTPVIKVSNGGYDAYLSKIGPTGKDLAWVHTWGGTGQDLVKDLSLFSSGTIYVTGNFYQTVDFDPSAGIDEKGCSEYGIFLSQFNSSGAYGWARIWCGTTGKGGLMSNGMASDSLGNPCITGRFRGTVDFNPGPDEDLHTANPGVEPDTGDAFIVKCKQDGLW